MVRMVFPASSLPCGRVPVTPPEAARVPLTWPVLSMMSDPPVNILTTPESFSAFPPVTFPAVSTIRVPEPQ